MAKILVTGGKGFIGSHLTDRLWELGHTVEVFDMADSHDLRDYVDVRSFVRGKDAVFHLAAIADLNYARLNEQETFDVNVKGTYNVASACKSFGARLYFASTCCVYGNQLVHPVTEATRENPAEVYACSKSAGEKIIEGIHHTYGLEYNHMRFATIYGPGTRPALATHIFMGQGLRREPITVHGDGKQTRTLTYVDDLIDGIVTLYQSGKVNGAWNLSTEEEVSAIQMAEDIRSVTESSSPIVFVPQRVGQTFREAISAQKMKKETGWEAKTKWAKGLMLMYEWFKATNQVNNRYRIPEAAKV